MVLLHVVTPSTIPLACWRAGTRSRRGDLYAHAVQRAKQDLHQVLQPELDGIAITRLLFRGDPAREIVKTARDRKAT
jgi:hypothetical protein